MTTMNRCVEVDVRLELKDYLRAVYWDHSYFALGKVLLLWFLIVAVSGWYNWRQQPEAPPTGILALLGGLILFACFTLFITKRQLESNRMIQEVTHYSFSDEGIAKTAPSYSSTSGWNTLYKAVETKRSFLLFIAKNQMYILPQRCFTDQSQIAEFREVLQYQLPGKTRLKND